jgi:hypothetical protein
MTARARRGSRVVKLIAVVPGAQADDAPHARSGTAVALEALRTGIVPLAATRRPEHIPHETSTIQAGDPDDAALQNEYNGEDTPGGSTPTPDQNDVDKIGRAYGLQDEDNGVTLRCAAEVLEHRDRKRSELRPPRTPQS